MFVSIDIGTDEPIIYNIECMYSNFMDFISKDVKLKAQALVQTKIQDFDLKIRSMKQTILINNSKIKVMNLSNRSKNKIEKMLQMELKRMNVNNYDQIVLNENENFNNLLEITKQQKIKIDIYQKKIASN